MGSGSRISEHFRRIFRTVVFPARIAIVAAGRSQAPGGDVMDPITVTPTITIDESELEERFVQASGPGGQNVNKVATAVQLRFDVANSPALTDYVRARLKTLAGKRMTREGVLVIDARRHRTQERNRQDARERLIELIREAAERQAPRRPTRPTLASRKRRLDSKTARAKIKKARGKPDMD